MLQDGSVLSLDKMSGDLTSVDPISAPKPGILSNPINKINQKNKNNPKSKNNPKNKNNLKNKKNLNLKNLLLKKRPRKRTH